MNPELGREVSEGREVKTGWYNDYFVPERRGEQNNKWREGDSSPKVLRKLLEITARTDAREAQLVKE